MGVIGLPTGDERVRAHVDAYISISQELRLVVERKGSSSQNSDKGAVDIYRRRRSSITPGE